MAFLGLRTRFCFLGFLPEKQSQRIEFLEKYKSLDLTLIFYSAPHDVTKDIETIYSVFGDRRAVAVREITKMYEEAIPFSLKDGLNKEPRGEFVIVVEGVSDDDKFANLTLEEHLDSYIKAGMDKKEALKKVAKERGVPKSELYKLTLNDR